MLKLLVLAVVAALVTDAPPTQVTPYETTTPAEAKAGPDKIICKKQEKLGTRLGEKKVCLTAGKWREVSEADRETIERIKRGCAPACQ